MSFIRRLFAWLKPPRAEHGGITAIVALVLANTLVFGIGALVIDIGRLYVEREQLQSGADAASMAVALSCAKGATCTNAAQTPLAQTYANKNANDRKADVQICINGVGCPVWNTPRTCPPLPTPPPGAVQGNWVEVRTTTLNTNNSTLVPPFFGRAVIPGYQGSRVGACARVHWGYPYIQKVFALGISMCDFKRMTNNNTVFYNPLGNLLNDLGLFNVIGLPPPTATAEGAIVQVLPLSALGLPLPSCTTPVDLTVPRGYAWLQYPDLRPPDSNCMMDLKVGDKPKSFLLSGLLIGATCAQKLQAIRGKTPVLVPIYQKIEQEVLTLAPQYVVAGFAPFVVTGYTDLLGGLVSGVGSLLNGGLPGLLTSVLCGASACINGYFTKTLVPSNNPVFGAGPAYGAMVVGRTG